MAAVDTLHFNWKFPKLIENITEEKGAGFSSAPPLNPPMIDNDFKSCKPGLKSSKQKLTNPNAFSFTFFHGLMNSIHLITQYILAKDKQIN